MDALMVHERHLPMNQWRYALFQFQEWHRNNRGEAVGGRVIR